MDKPYVLTENDNFAVVFKPHKMHTSFVSSVRKNVKLENHTEIKNISENISNNGNMTLHEWYAASNLHVFDVMHRLDYETHGLVLFAKNETSYNFFIAAQDRGEFIKEYSAVCCMDHNLAHNNFSNNNSSINSRDFHDVTVTAAGFPESPAFNFESLHKKPFFIESFFRPYGQGRKLVRPVIDDSKKHKEIAKDKGGFYKTEISNINDNIFTVRIKRGFRHQIRCHLCWIGYPIVNDPLYSSGYSHNKTESHSDFLALRSHALFFPDPNSGKQCEFRISPLNKVPGTASSI